MAICPNVTASADRHRHASRKHHASKAPKSPTRQATQRNPSSQTANKTPPANMARGASKPMSEAYTQEQIRVISPAKARSPLSQGATKWVPFPTAWPFTLPWPSMTLTHMKSWS